MAINFGRIKLGYTTGTSFTYNNSSYNGYYTVVDQVPYRGKLTYTEILSNKDNYINNVLVSNFSFDRTFTGSPNLYYTIQDFTVPNGVEITAKVINPFFKKFHENTAYLYSRLFMYDSKLPSSTSTTLIAVTGGGDSLRFYSNPNNFTPASFDSNITLSGYNLNSTRTLAYKFNEINNNFAIFTASSSSFVALTGNISNVTQNISSVGISLSTNFVNEDPDDLQYKDIIGMEVIGDFLFVLDKGNNSLVKYNIYNFYSGDISNPKQRVTVEIKSGGGKFLPSSFNSPNLITSTENSVIIYQQSDRFFKQYDVNLNLLNYGRLFRRVNDEVIALGYNKVYNLVACILKTNQEYTFYYLDKQFRILESYPFNIRLSQGEFIKKMLFSENDSNVFYIITNKYVYKMLVSNPSDFLGVFSNSNLKIIDDSGDYLGAALIGSNSNYDTIVLAKKDRFFILNEPNLLTDVLKTRDFPNYPIRDVYLDKEEYIQANYLNKELYKIFENVIRIKNQIIGSFYGKYQLTNQQLSYEDSLYTPSLVLEGINYFSNYDFLNITNDFDFFVHENEPLNNVVINRCFHNLYKLQESVLASTKVTVNTLVPYLTTDNLLYIN